MRTEGLGHSKISKDRRGNRTRNLAFCGALPEPNGKMKLLSDKQYYVTKCGELVFSWFLAQFVNSDDSEHGVRKRGAFMQTFPRLRCVTPASAFSSSNVGNCSTLFPRWKETKAIPKSCGSGGYAPRVWTKFGACSVVVLILNYY